MFHSSADLYEIQDVENICQRDLRGMRSKRSGHGNTKICFGVSMLLDVRLQKQIQLHVG